MSIANSANVVGCSICGAYHIRPGSIRQANPLTEVGFCEKCGKETRTSRGTWLCTSCGKPTIRVDTIEAGPSRDGGWHHVGYCDHCKVRRKLTLSVRMMSGTELFGKIADMRAAGTPVGIATRSDDGPWNVLGEPGSVALPGTNSTPGAQGAIPSRIKHAGKTDADLLDDYVKKKD